MNDKQRPMQPSLELIDEIFTRKVRRAREANPVEKMLDGARLFDMVCRIASDGIRHRHPEASESEIRAMLFDQVNLLRKLEQSS
jgi:hypothetical protein